MRKREKLMPFSNAQRTRIGLEKGELIKEYFSDDRLRWI
jgi:hypothetical protein